MYTHEPDQATGQALVTMLDWLTRDGQAYAAANSYVSLPSQVQRLARTMLQQVTGPTGTPPELTGTQIRAVATPGLPSAGSQK